MFRCEDYQKLSEFQLIYNWLQFPQQSSLLLWTNFAEYVLFFFSRKNNVTFGINLSKEKKQASTWALNFKVLPYSTINIIDVSSSTTVKAQYPELNFIRANNVLEFMKKFSMDLEF